jgi:acetyltransferase-like isoleucine patch superfamily enzyme
VHSFRIEVALHDILAIIESVRNYGHEEAPFYLHPTPRHVPPREEVGENPSLQERRARAPAMGEPRRLQAGIVDVEFGDDVTVVEPVNLYGCTLGDDVFVGPFVEIQRGVTVGARTRVQSHAFICELVSIGEDCFISHGAKFINDPFSIGGPAHGDRSQWKETVVGDRVSIGTNATIMPVSICDDVVIGAGAVVTKDITDSGTYAGNPARRL